MDDIAETLLYACGCSLIVLGLAAIWFGIVAVVKLSMMVWAL